MNAELIKEQFFKFLEENNCKDEYFNNNKLQIGDRSWVKSFNCLLHEDPVCLIQDAFKWSETDKGHNFWSDLSYEWDNIYCNYLSKGKIYYKLDEIWSD